MSDRGGTEHQHPAFDVKNGVAAVPEKALENLGVLGVHGDHFLPRPLI